MKRQITMILLVLASALGSMARQPERGYRGFIDWSNSYRENSDNWYHDSYFYSGLSTSHGYQFNPWLFVGAGLDWEHQWKEGFNNNIFAAFVQGRTDLQFGKFTPFGDVRLGFSMTDGGGVYFSPTIGYRFNWGRKAGINIGVGLTVQGYTTDIYDIALSPEGYWTFGEKLYTHHGANTYFSFRVGFDF